jgi:RHS repeat-associated protein
LPPAATARDTLPMLARLLSLAAALLLAIASPQAHANARKLQSETARPARVSLEQYASAEIIDATPSRIREICLVPLKCASTFGVTGYQKDSATGLYYAGARFYDPLIGGFNGMDPWSGDNARPITLNKYLYANGNPTVYVDRDGRCGVLATAMPMFSTVCGIADGAIIGVNPFSFEGEAAIENYRRGQGLGIAEDALGTAKGVIDLNIDFYLAGIQSATGHDLGAGDVIGATIAGSVDYLENLPVRVAEGLAESNAEFSVSVEHGEHERAGRATSPYAASAFAAMFPGARALGSFGRLATPKLPDFNPASNYLSLGDDFASGRAPDTSGAARTEISVESTVGDVANGPGPLLRPVQRYEVMTYEASTGRAVTGDNLTGDHVPTIAAIRQNVEATLGQKLTRAQAIALRNNTNVVVIDHDLHKAGRTYFSANTRSQIAQDACDLGAAACRDQATHLRNAPRLGYSSSELQAAFESLNSRNATLFDQLSTKKGIKEFFEKMGL